MEHVTTTEQIARAEAQVTELFHRFADGRILTLEVAAEEGRVLETHGDHDHVLCPWGRRDYAIDRYEKAKAAG